MARPCCCCNNRAGSALGSVTSLTIGIAHALYCFVFWYLFMYHTTNPVSFQQLYEHDLEKFIFLCVVAVFGLFLIVGSILLMCGVGARSICLLVTWSIIVSLHLVACVLGIAAVIYALTAHQVRVEEALFWLCLAALVLFVVSIVFHSWILCAVCAFRRDVQKHGEYQTAAKVIHFNRSSHNNNNNNINATTTKTTGGAPAFAQAVEAQPMDINEYRQQQRRILAEQQQQQHQVSHLRNRDGTLL